MIYGYVTNDVFPLLVTYAVGDALSIIFLSVYYYWSTEKKHVLKVCASILAVNILVTTYAVLGYNLQEHSIVIRVVGIIAIGSSIFFYASPLTTIKKVLQTKNAASIPFGMVVVGTINNTLWIIYGFLINDILLITPTIVNGTLGAIQLVLYVIYRPSGKDTHNLPDVIPQKVEKDVENPSTTSISGNTEPEMKEMKEITIDAVELQSPKFIELRSPSHIELKV
jgi:solute carrier family 50 protein (sugar transporter)